MAGSFALSDYPVTHEKTSVTVSFTGTTAGYYYRVTTTSGGTTIFTGGGSGTGLSRTISGGTWPVPGANTTIYLQESTTGTTGTWVYTGSSATVTRAAVSPPTGMSFQDSFGNPCTVTATASGTASASGYQYSTSSATGPWGSGVFTSRSRGTSLTVYARASYIYNSVTYNSVGSAGFAYTVPAADSTPSVTDFTNLTNVAPGSVATSTAITASAYNVDISVSVSGGEYSLNGTSFTATAGSITTASQSIYVRHTAPNSYGSNTSTILTVGGVDKTFQSTTVAAPDTTITVSPTSLNVAFDDIANKTVSLGGLTSAHYYRVFNGLFGSLPGPDGYVTGGTTASVTDIFTGAPTANFSYSVDASRYSTGPWVSTGNSVSIVKADVPTPTLTGSTSGTGQLATVTITASGGTTNTTYEYKFGTGAYSTTNTLANQTRGTTIALYAKIKYLYPFPLPSGTLYEKTATINYTVGYVPPDTIISIGTGSTAPIDDTLTAEDVANKTVLLDGDTTGTTYRLYGGANSNFTSETEFGVFSGNDTASGGFTLTVSPAELPPTNTTWYYRIKASKAAGSPYYGDGLEYICTTDGTTPLTFTISRAADTYPDAFSFTPVSVGVGVTATSGSATITGLQAAATVSVSGATGSQFQIGTGSWVTSGTITNNQTIKVRHTASSDFGQSTTTTLDIGGRTADFVATTTIPTLTFTSNSQTITQSATSSSTWSVTGAPTGAVCRLYVAAASGGATIGTATTSGAATAGQALSIPAISTANKLPTGTSTTNYRLDIASSSTGLFVDTGLTASVRRLAGPPTIDPNQNFNTTTASNTFSHTILLSNSGVGGTLSYAASKTASTYATVTTWGASPTVTLERGFTYYLWARTDTDASSAAVLSAVTPYATGATVDTVIAATGTYMIKSDNLPDIAIPSNITTMNISITGGNSGTEYGVFKNFNLHNSAVADASGNATVAVSYNPGPPATAGGLPEYGNTAEYWIQARVSQAVGGDPNGAWSAICTGTINGVNSGFGTSLNQIRWIMKRKVPAPVIGTITQPLTWTQTATIQVAATGVPVPVPNQSPFTNLYYARVLGTWGAANANTLTGYTRNTSEPVYVYQEGLAAGTSSDVATTNFTASYNTPDVDLTGITLTPSGGTAVNGDLTILNQTSVDIAWTGGTANTKYRTVRTGSPDIEVTTEGDNDTGGVIGIAELPAEGAVSTYKIQARVGLDKGGNNNFSPCIVSLPSKNPFTITRLDDTPTGYSALAGNITGVLPGTLYYATFTTGAPGTTSPGTGYTIAGIDTPVTVSVSNGKWKRGAGSFVTTAASNVVNGEVIYFEAQAASTTATETTHSLTIGSVTQSFTTYTIDGATPTFPYLAGDVASAALDTFYFATFSQTAAGTTSPGTGFSLSANQVTQTITVTSVNGEFALAAGGPWVTSNTAVPSTATIYFRGKSSATGGVETTHSLTIGNAPQRSFKTTTVSDTTPEGYLGLSANVIGAPLNTYHYATFSTGTAAGTTANGTAYTLNDVNQPVTVTATNGEFSINAGTTWQTSLTSVAKGSLIYYRARSSTSAGSTTTHSLQIGATLRDFTIQTAAETNKIVGTVTVSATELTGSNNSNVTVSWTPVTNPQHNYRITRTDKDPDVVVVTSTNSSPATLNFADANDLPTEGVIGIYKLEVRRPTTSNGDNQWYTAEITAGNAATWTITRIKEPIVSATQIFNTSSNVTNISHSIELEEDGVGGSLQYGWHTTNVVGSVTNWQAQALFVSAFTRGSTYYFFARRSTATSDFSVAGPFVIPPYTPSNYGIEVYSSTGAKTVLGVSSLPTNLITCRIGSIASSAFIAAGASVTVTAPGVTTTNGADVFILVYYDGTSNLFDKFTITRGTGTFTITNTDTVGRTHYFIVGKYR